MEIVKGCCFCICPLSCLCHTLSHMCTLSVGWFLLGWRSKHRCYLNRFNKSWLTEDWRPFEMHLKAEILISVLPYAILSLERRVGQFFPLILNSPLVFQLLLCQCAFVQFVKLDSNICASNLGNEYHSCLTTSEWFLPNVNRFREEEEGRKSSLGRNPGKWQNLNCSQICPSVCQTRPGVLKHFSCGSTGTRETNYLQRHFSSRV